MNDLLNYILETEDIFKPISPEEIPGRRKQYLKFVIDELGDKVVYNEDGTIDVNDSLDLSSLELTSLLDLPYRIRKVTGDFDCSDNELTSLEGAPKFIDSNFYCSYNKLTSLEGAPKEIGDSFYCDNNELTSLEGIPEYIGGNFYCQDNKLSRNIEVYSKVEGIIYR